MASAQISENIGPFGRKMRPMHGNLYRTLHDEPA